VKLAITVEMNIGKYTREVERLCCAKCRTAVATKNRGLVHFPEEVYAVIKEVWR
jgi:hypothetical protein